MNRPRVTALFVILLFAAGVASGQSIGTNASEPGVFPERANSCASERSVLLKFVVWNRDRLRVRRCPFGSCQAARPSFSFRA